MTSNESLGDIPVCPLLEEVVCASPSKEGDVRKNIVKKPTSTSVEDAALL